jgi:nucleotide-binding universal stress UspA family protein
MTVSDRFHTAIVGVDGSEESFAALDQARRLLASDGTLIALIVCEEHLAAQAGYNASRIAAEMHKAAEGAAARSRASLANLPKAEVSLVHGRPTPSLLATAAQHQADLIAVGSHEHSRAAAIAIGSVASEILHRAPQSVLIARKDDGAFRSIVAGVDGSRSSLAALGVARDLAGDIDVRLRVIAADRGKPIHLDALVDVRDAEWVQAHPVDCLVAAAEEADLVVIGSRGLHGLASLGSVSERVAHRARCSVLVIRDATLDADRVAEEAVSATTPRA